MINETYTYVSILTNKFYGSSFDLTAMVLNLFDTSTVFVRRFSATEKGQMREITLAAGIHF